MMLLKRFRLGGVIILAAFLRCLFINSRPIEYDPAFSIFLSQLSLDRIIAGTAADTMPPLYYFLLHFWMLAGGGNVLWSIRLLNVILSLAGLFVLYLFIRDLFDEDAGFYAALIAAISPIQIFHAQDVRMYALLQLGQLGFVYFFMRIWKTGRDLKNGWHWLGVVLCGTVTLYSHNVGGFFLVVPALFLVIRREWNLLLRLCFSYGLMALLFLPWAFFLPTQFAKVQTAFWTPKPGFVEVFQVMLQFSSNLPLPDLLTTGLAAVIAIQIAVIITLELVRSKAHSKEKLFLGLCLFTSPVLLFLVSYLIRPVFVARGFLVCSLIFYGMGGIVISKGLKKGIGWLVLGGFILSVLIGLPYQINYRSFPRSPFDEAVQYLKQIKDTDVRVVHDNKLSFFPMHYFDPQLNQSFLPDEPGSANDTFAPGSQKAMNLYPEKDIQQAVENAREVYFVVFEETVNEYQNMGMDQHPTLKWLNQHYTEEETISFNDLWIVHFGSKKND